MALSFTQTDTNGACGVIAACSGLSIGATTANKQSSNGGTAGITAVTLSHSATPFTNLIFLEFECIVGAGVTWDAGTWTVRINVTTANADVDWEDIYICRVNSSCVNQATIGSNTTNDQNLTATGVLSATVSGSAQTPGVGDKVLVICAFTDNTAHGTESWAITPNQNIDSPFTPPASARRIFVVT